MTTRKRQSRWSRRKGQRTLLQIAILTTVLAFIALDSPAVRATVNATLVWLAIRGLIIGATVLAIMWTYQFCRPPKVKRRKKTYDTRVSSRKRSQASSKKFSRDSSVKKNTASTDASPWTTDSPAPKHARRARTSTTSISESVGDADAYRVPMTEVWHSESPEIPIHEPSARDRLLKQQLSGVHSFSHTEGEEDW